MAYTAHDKVDPGSSLLGCLPLSRTTQKKAVRKNRLSLPCSDTLAYRLLMRQDVMVRTMTTFRFPGWLRVSIATAEEMTCFAEALARVIRDR